MVCVWMQFQTCLLPPSLSQPVSTNNFSTDAWDLLDFLCLFFRLPLHSSQHHKESLFFLFFASSIIRLRSHGGLSPFSSFASVCSPHIRLFIAASLSLCVFFLRLSLDLCFLSFSFLSLFLVSEPSLLLVFLPFSTSSSGLVAASSLAPPSFLLSLLLPIAFSGFLFRLTARKSRKLQARQSTALSRALHHASEVLHNRRAVRALNAEVLENKNFEREVRTKGKKGTEDGGRETLLPLVS